MKRSFIVLLLLLIVIQPVIHTFPQSPEHPFNPDTDAPTNLRIFQQAWQKINTHYFDPTFNSVDWEKARKTYLPQARQAQNMDDLLHVIAQMMAELKTSLLSVKYIPDPDKMRFKERIGRNLEKGEIWVFDDGFEYRVIEGQFVVSRVTPRSPSNRAGVEPGWIWTAFDSHTISADKPLEIGRRAEGQEGLYRFRDLNDTEVTLSLAFEFFKATPDPPVSARKLGGDISYIKILGFSSGIGDWIKEVTGYYHRAKALIIDLRGNGGDSEKEAAKCLGPLFRDDKEFGTFIKRDGGLRKVKIQGQGRNAFAGDIVVLTDESTGSSAEIYCAVIRENLRGKIIGRKIRGGVLYSNDFNLSNNVVLTVPTQDYRTPKGEKLEGAGITPDITVGQQTLEDFRTGRDPVLEKALKYLQNSEINNPEIS